MKKVNTLRVRGDESLIIVKENAVVRISSSDVLALWGFGLGLVLIVAFIVFKLKEGLGFVNDSYLGLQRIDLKIAQQAESIRPLAENYFIQIRQETESINGQVKKDFDLLQSEWEKLIKEWQELRVQIKSEAQNEKLKTYTEDTAEIDVVLDMSHPF